MSSQMWSIGPLNSEKYAIERRPPPWKTGENLLSRQ